MWDYSERGRRISVPAIGEREPLVPSDVPRKQKQQVIVKAFDMILPNELEELITKHVSEGYYIQDSSIENYQGRLNGIYVFMLKEG